jgi:phosphoglycolate phosphatase
LKYAGIVFDLDGTLIDTLADLSAAMNAAMRQLGLPEHSPEACRQMIGNGIRTFALRAVGPDHQHLADRAVELMRAEYQRNLVVHSRVYEGLSQVVERMAAAGIRMGVITNKHQKEAETIIRHFFGARMACVAGVDEDTPVKPDRDASSPPSDGPVAGSGPVCGRQRCRYRDGPAGRNGFFGSRMGLSGSAGPCRSGGGRYY